ncbi:hypothetical protein MNBD_NITROSPINAE02-562 [hydrothermal vent metagenome]|uniref:Uncharacterized protein n=1 Tax=hydrothermal vent metagenome TaxID=652676 RepID=A0A3B1BTI0_9ZZZZ
MHCPTCGFVNKSSAPESYCHGCGAVLKKPFIDPHGEALYAVDLKRVPMKRMVAAIVRGKGYIEKVMFAPFAVWSVLMRRVSRGPWVKPRYKGSVLRYVAVSLDKEPGIDKNRLRIVTDELGKSGFVPAMDRLCETYYPGAYQRIFVGETKKVYAVASFSSAMGKSDLQIVTILKGKRGLVSVSNAFPDFIEDPGSKTIYSSSSDTRTLINALAEVAPLRMRMVEGFGLRALLRGLGESHKRAFERAIKEKNLIPINEQSAISHTAEISGAPECAVHQGVIAIRRCALCGKPLCGQCQFDFEEREYCGGCLPEGADRSGDPPLDFSGEYTPAGFMTRASIRVAELSIFFWLALALFPAGSSAASIIVYQALVIAGFIAYFQTSVALWGATPMQRLAGLTVVDASGERLSVTSTIVRTGYLLLTLIMIAPALGYLPAIWDKYKRGWHDRISGALVVTDNAPMKEKAGAIILGLMIACGIYNYSPIYDFGTKIVFSTLQNLTPPGSVSLESVWSQRARKNSVLLDDEQVISISHGKLTALGRSTGLAIWSSPAPGIEMVSGSSAAKYYMAIEEMADMTRLHAIGKKNGKEAWRVELRGKLISGPLAYGDGVRLIAGRLVTAIDNNGQIVWSQKPVETPTAIYGAGENILVETRDGEARATYVYSQKEGKEVVKLDGLSPAAMVGDHKYLLTGEGGTSLLDLSTVKIAWSIPDRLSITDSVIRPGPVLHSLKSARRMSDGMRAYSYPDGCVYTGSFKKVVVLYCAREGTLNIANATTGASLAVMQSAPVFRTKFIGEDKGGYVLLTLQPIKELLVNANLFYLEYDNRTVTVFNVGHFREEPEIEYLKGEGLLFKSSTVVGLYKTPW